MTVAAAQAAASSLRDALQDYGVRTSIELQPGVGPSHDPWGPAPFVRNLGHHIASYPPGTPGLAVVKGGRKGASPLQGPLANCYGGFDLTARIITMGWANHPGAGGPWSVPGWGTVPKDNGRPYTLGWEFEGGYLDYTDEMHEFMSRCGAASLDWLGTHNGREPAPLECHDEHKGWAPGRKPDRKGYTTASGRARIAAVRGTTSGGFLMALSDAKQEELHLATLQIRDTLGARGGYLTKTEDSVAFIVRDVQRSALPALMKAASGVGVTADDVAAAIVPALVPAVVAAVVDEVDEVTGLDGAQVEAITDRVFRRVLGGLDEPA